MILTRTDVPAEKIHGLFCNDVGYQTPKVDTRAAIFKDGKILDYSQGTAPPIA